MTKVVGAGELPISRANRSDNDGDNLGWLSKQQGW
jgi:hypothetical protein